MANSHGQERNAMSEDTQRYRVLFGDAGTMANEEKCAIDIEQPDIATLEEIEELARTFLEDQVEAAEDWAWLSTSKIERCYSCGRMRELGLIHTCPSGG